MQELASMVLEDASGKQPDMIGSSHQAGQTSIVESASKGQPIVPGAQSPTPLSEAASAAGDKGPDTGSHSLPSAQPGFLSNTNEIRPTAWASTAQEPGRDLPGRNAQPEHGLACVHADTAAQIWAQSPACTATDAMLQAADANAQAVAASTTLNASEQPGDDPCKSAKPAEKHADDACDQPPVKDQSAKHPVASQGKSDEPPACSEQQQQPPADSVKENQTANAGYQQPAATNSQPQKATPSAAQPPATAPKGSKATAVKSGSAGTKRAPTAYFIFANRHRSSAKQELVAKGHGPKVSVAEASLL